MARLFAAVFVLALLAWVQALTIRPTGVQEMAMADSPSE